MFLRRVWWHTIVWLGVFLLWLLATRQFHPTWAIAISATAVLVSASALAVYLNSLYLLPLLARGGILWWQYAASLLATVIVLDLLAVVSIQAIYDRLWGPDPLRFGFWFNVLSDGFIIALHLAIAAGVAWVWKRLRQKTKG